MNTGTQTRYTTIMNKDFLILMVVTAVSHIGFQILSPNLPKYATAMGAASSVVGFVSAAYAFAALLTRPFSGTATDRLNKKKVLLVSMAGVTLTLLSYTLVDSVAALIALRFVNGLFFGFNSTVTLAMVANTLPEDKMTQGIGIYGMLMMAGQAVAPSIGIYVVESMGYKPLFLIAFASSAVGLALAVFIRDQPTLPEQKKLVWYQRMISVSSCAPSAIGMMNACARGAVNTFIVLLSDERGIGNIGLFFTVFTATIIVIRPLYSMVADRIPAKYCVHASSIAVILSMIAINRSYSLVGMLIAAVLNGFGSGVSQPLLQTMCIRNESPDRRGAASSTYYIGADLGNIFGPIIMSFAVSFVGYGSAFLTMILPLALGMVIMVWMDRKGYRDVSASEPD